MNPSQTLHVAFGIFVQSNGLCGVNLYRDLPFARWLGHPESPPRGYQEDSSLQYKLRIPGFVPSTIDHRPVEWGEFTRSLTDRRNGVRRPFQHTRPPVGGRFVAHWTYTWSHGHLRSTQTRPMGLPSTCGARGVNVGIYSIHGVYGVYLGSVRSDL